MKKNPQIQNYGKVLITLANAPDPHQAYKDLFSAIAKAFLGFSSGFVDDAFAVLDTIYEFRREGDRDLVKLLDLLIQEENLKLSVSLCFENQQMQLINYDREKRTFEGCSVVFKYEASNIDDLGAVVPHYGETWGYNFETLRERLGEKLGQETLGEIEKLVRLADQISQIKDVLLKEEEEKHKLELFKKEGKDALERVKLFENWARYYHRRVRSYRYIQKLQQQVQCALSDIVNGRVKDSKTIQYFLSVYEKIGHKMSVREDGALEDITGLRLNQTISEPEVIFGQYNQYERMVAFCLVKILEKSAYQRLFHRCEQCGGFYITATQRAARFCSDKCRFQYHNRGGVNATRK